MKTLKRMLESALLFLLRALPRFAAACAVSRIRFRDGKLSLALRRACYRRLCAAAGDGLYVMPSVYIFHPENLFIGDNVSIHEFSYIHPYRGAGHIRIGNNVLIAHGCSMVASEHQTRQPDAPIRDCPETYMPIVIEDDVWIGANATILAGVTVRRGAVIAAGAVVTRDVPENCIYGGVPAKLISERFPEKQ